MLVDGLFVRIELMYVSSSWVDFWMAAQICENYVIYNYTLIRSKLSSRPSSSVG